LMVDPFGHGFCLVQFLGRGYEEIADKRRVGGIEAAPIESTDSYIE
jgi:hypothetical protein